MFFCNLPKYLFIRRYLKLEHNQENFVKIKTQLGKHLEEFRKCINQIYFDYWTELSSHCGVFHGIKNFKCKNYNDVKQAIREVKSWDEVQKFAILFYVSFDFIPNWREGVAEAVLQKLGFQINDKGMKDGDRKKKTFIVKMCSQQLTNMRKNASSLGRNTSGFSFTTQRWGKHIKEGKEKDYREYQHFYPWMSLGTYVSTLLPNYCLIFVTKLLFHTLSYQIYESILIYKNTDYDPSKKRRRYRKNTGEDDDDSVIKKKKKTRSIANMSAEELEEEIKETEATLLKMKQKIVELLDVSDDDDGEVNFDIDNPVQNKITYSPARMKPVRASLLYT